MNDCIVRTTGDSPDFSMIWMHGLGADATDFVPVIPELDLPASARGRFIFPNAPYQPVTCNGGYEMRSWYDILSLAPNDRRVDVAGLEAACARVMALIEQEIKAGIAESRIFLAGFSQGGAVAYTAALLGQRRLGGIIALSTYLPAVDALQGRYSDISRDIPVFAAHGDDDEVVSLRLGEMARDLLIARGMQVNWLTYPMGHMVVLPEIHALGSWLAARLGTTD